jgi:phage I-like protein
VARPCSRTKLAKTGGQQSSTTQRARLVVSAPLLGSNGALPTEFQIFHAGLNTTEKGDFLFDSQAAQDVIADASRRGVRVMIDLEHLSLDQESRAFDPDARGSCLLKVGDDGALIATDVKWTNDGGTRLTEGRQSYISPVVDYDEKTRRVKAIHNLALTAIPATHGAQQLAAANMRTKLGDGAEGGDPASRSGLEQLGLEPTATLDDIVGAIKKLDGQLDALTADDDLDEDEEDDEDDLDDAEMSAAGAAPPPAPAKPDAPPDEKKATMAARKQARKTVRLARRTAHREILTKTGEKTTLAALSKIETWRSAYLDVEASREKLAKERAALELTERREHVTSWVKLGKEDPGTAFDPETKALLEPWASLPIEKIRERSEKLKAGAPKTPNAKPPTNDGVPKMNASGSAPGGTAVVDAATAESLRRQGLDPEIAKLKFSDPAAYSAALRKRRDERGVRS